MAEEELHGHQIHWGGGEIDSPCHSLMHSYSASHRQQPDTQRARPVKSPDCSGIWTAFISILELDSSADLARACHHHCPQADPVHYTCTTANALISSHLLTLSAQVPCLATKLVDI